MSDAADGKIVFGEWLPDQGDLDNPGLTEAKNVLPREGTYKPFEPLSTGGNALSARPYGGIVLYNPVSNATYLYAGTQQALWRQLYALGTWTDVKSGAYSASTEAWEFVYQSDFVIATNYYDVPQKATLGTGNFSALAGGGTTAPNARRVGKIGQFVLLGDLDDAGTKYPHAVQWPGIDDPEDWQTPGTAAAIAVQAGRQYLDPEWGAVTAIVGGDQFGIAAQTGGLTRLTYQGGNEVFQFDKIAGAQGCVYPHSIVENNGLWYYIAKSGFCVTDGSRAELIGDKKVDQYFWQGSNQGAEIERVYAGIDPWRKLIYWLYQGTLGATPTKILAYNYKDNRFTRCDQTAELLLSVAQGENTSLVGTQIVSFDTSHKRGKFNGTPGTAIITSQEAEFTLGSNTFISGVKPLITGSPTITVALGTRELQSASVAYTSEVTPTSRTGVADFRSEARYARARVTLAGTFEKASGIEYQTEPSGAT
jgi:hypothetical protein